MLQATFVALNVPKIYEENSDPPTPIHQCQPNEPHESNGMLQPLVERKWYFVFHHKVQKENEEPFISIFINTQFKSGYTK